MSKQDIKETYYKYRSLKDFKFFMDIIINNRLYAAEYTTLNDPMEGRYTMKAAEVEKRIKEEIKAKKPTVKICSLSMGCADGLMWAHYADGHKGVVIELTVNNKTPKQVYYDGIGSIEIPNQDNYEESLEKIFTHKEPAWAYEQEFRVLTRDNFIDVEINKIIFGFKMDKQDKELIEKIISKYSPSVKLCEIVRAKKGGLMQKLYASKPNMLK